MSSLCVQGFNTQDEQFPSGDVHLWTEFFKRLLAEVAAPYLDGRIIGPRQAGSTILPRRAEKPGNPSVAVCASLAFLQKYVLLIYPELQGHGGSLPVGRRNKGL